MDRMRETSIYRQTHWRGSFAEATEVNINGYLPQVSSPSQQYHKFYSGSQTCSVRSMLCMVQNKVAQMYFCLNGIPSRCHLLGSQIQLHHSEHVSPENGLDTSMWPQLKPMKYKEMFHRNFQEKHSLKMHFEAEHWWLMPVILTIWEAEIRRMVVWCWPGQIVCETQCPK
jgi:hypothetical protein